MEHKSTYNSRKRVRRPQLLLVAFATLFGAAFWQGCSLATYFRAQNAYQNHNFNDAAGLYAQAANQGISDAMRMLGLMYENGQGMRRDDTEALRWYNKAIASGNTLAMANLATLYEYSGKIRDYQKAH